MSEGAGESESGKGERGVGRQRGEKGERGGKDEQGGVRWGEGGRGKGEGEGAVPNTSVTDLSRT
jgi:hypothetical protein